MDFNFELILFYAVLVCGLIALFDQLFLAKKRSKDAKLPILIDYARGFFPVLLIVFLLRSFLFEPFRIPSGSLKPTLLVGDFVITNKYEYGIRLPVIHKKIFPVHDIQRGDIVVFRYPVDPSIDYIKRIVGLPHDHITYINKVLYINGHEMPQTFTRTLEDKDDAGNLDSLIQKEENLLGVKHAIYIDPGVHSPDLIDVIVPEGMYFAMGDNRDNSGDSRHWGFVPDENIIGKAVRVWMSWDGGSSDWPHKIRWNRIGKSING